MSKITPPHIAFRGIVFHVAFTCTLLIACTCCNNQTTKPVEPAPIAHELLYNPDSLVFYARRAYLDDDPQGLYIIGAAAFLRADDPNFPDSCTTVPLDEAAIMLLRAAELGHPDARQLIYTLDAAGCWHHSLPEDK